MSVNQKYCLKAHDTITTTAVSPKTWQKKQSVHPQKTVRQQTDKQNAEAKQKTKQSSLIIHKKRRNPKILIPQFQKTQRKMNTRVGKWTVRASPRRKTDDWKRLLITSSSFTGPHLDVGQTKASKFLSKRCSTSRRNRSSQRDDQGPSASTPTTHLHSAAGRSVRRNACQPQTHGRTNPTINGDTYHNEERTNPLPKMATPFITRAGCKRFMHPWWQNGPTNNQQTDLPEWRITVTHRDESRVQSPKTMKLENNFPSDFSFVISILYSWPILHCDVKCVILKKKIIIHHLSFLTKNEKKNLENR